MMMVLRPQGIIAAKGVDVEGAGDDRGMGGGPVRDGGEEWRQGGQRKEPGRSTYSITAAKLYILYLIVINKCSDGSVANLPFKDVMTDRQADQLTNRRIGKVARSACK